MRVRVNPGKCQGHGMCNIVCPEVFKYDDDGFAYVVQEKENVAGDLEDDVKLAEIQCPERAIVLED